MATFNGHAFIAEQLRSLAMQTRLPDELIVSDDGSTDGTLEAVATFADSAPFPVHVLHDGRRLGYALNFDRALAACHGDVVFLSDQDDVWMPNKIERVLAEFERQPSAKLIIHDCIFTDEALSHSGTTELTNLRRIRRSTDGFVSGCCTAVRRDLLAAALPIPSAFGGHDSWLHGLAQLLDRRVILPEPLIYYRRHGRNLSSTASASVMPVNWFWGSLRWIQLKIHATSPARHALTLASTEANWRAVAERLKEIDHDPERLPDLAPEVLQRAQAIVDGWIRDTHERVRALALPRPKRPPAIFGALARGAYRGFNRPWSVIIDILAPASGPTDDPG